MVGGGGGGLGHAPTNFDPEWIFFYKLFTVWKHQIFLLQLSGYN